MSATFIECLHTLEEFESVQGDWDSFMHEYFPRNYGRSHGWLSAWWRTYHAGRTALVFIQRRGSDRGIVAAAPLMIRRESFGGFPVRMLQALGRGIGSDDFLVGPQGESFIPCVFQELAARKPWHVAAFYRLSTGEGGGMLLSARGKLAPHAELDESADFYLDLPYSYQAFLKSRSSKFRNNLLQATKRLEQEGALSMEVLDPFRQLDRVQELCGAVARESWQFREGKSHFNEHAGASFYANLARGGRGTGGEEFVVLLTGGRPVAYLLGCRRGASYFLVDTAFDAGFRNYSVGRVLISWNIERLLQLGGIDRFHMEGDGEYKRYYASGAQPTMFLSLYNRSFYARSVRILRQSRLHRFIKEALSARNVNAQS